MATKKISGLNNITMHHDVYGNASRKTVTYKANAAAAGESVAVMPLPSGMRIDRVETRITDVAAAGGLVDVGYETAEANPVAAHFANDIDMNALGAHHWIGKPLEIDVDYRTLILTFPNAVAAPFEIVVIVDYVFVGNG